MQNIPYAVLFLHAFPLNKNMYQFQFDTLRKENIPFIAVDYPGFGNVPVFKTFKSLTQYTDYVVSKIFEAGVNKVIAVGDSMGGYIMFDMVRRHKEILQGLVFVSTRAEADTQDAKQARFMTIEKVKKEGKNFLIDAMLEAQTSPSTKEDKEKMEKLRCLMLQATEEGIINALTAMAHREDNTGILKNIDIPTIVVAGKDDEKVTPPEVVKKIAEGIPNAKFYEIPKSAHLPPFENPEEFNKILLEFIKECL
jgi:3-oxoadipate enol-lactonase